jgi:hypothetical protein
MDEGNHLVGVKNPEADSVSVPIAGREAARRAHLPKTLLARFQGQPAIIPVDPPTFLDYEWTEIVLMVAQEESSTELDIKLHPEPETAASAEIFGDLRIDKSSHPIAALFKGKWV